MVLMELNLPVHIKHFKDGYPLCWNLDQDGLFEGTWDETQVTCKECINYLKEE